MAEFFDESKLLADLEYPGWYIRIQPEYQRVMQQAEDSDEHTRRRMKEEIYGWFEQLLEDKKVPLGSSGHNFDAERKPIDMVIIHHTAEESGMRLSRLNAMHLIRIYAPYYANPTYASEEYIKGKPIYSGHFYKGEQVFWAYHWLVRKNGKAERILKDKEVGWQAGNWDVNCASVAICLDGEFRDSTPPTPMQKAAATIIRDHYSHVSPNKILGHREVNPKTDCPGSRFLKGWKLHIIEALEKGRK